MADYNERKKAVKDCKRYIETHLYEKITIHDLASHAHISDMSLRRYFVEIGGYTIHEYVRLRRIHMAARYLRHGGDVATAFKASCFSSQSGFAKAFSAIYGVTPLGIRKKPRYGPDEGAEDRQEAGLHRRRLCLSGDGTDQLGGLRRLLHHPGFPGSLSERVGADRRGL